MEKIIAAEIPHHGFDAEILHKIEDSTKKLSLEDSVMYYGFPIFKDYEDSSVKTNILILSKFHGLILIQSTTNADIQFSDENLTQAFNLLDAALKKARYLEKVKETLTSLWRVLCFLSKTLKPRMNKLTHMKIYMIS